MAFVGACHEDRVAVRSCLHDRLGAEIAAGTRPVVDDEWLAETLRQPLTHQARNDVSRAARGEWHDQPHRPRRIGLRPCNPRHSRQRGSARGQMQKLLRRGSFIGVLLPDRLYCARVNGRGRAMRAWIDRTRASS